MLQSFFRRSFVLLQSASCKTLERRRLSTTYRLECALRENRINAFRAMVQKDNTLLRDSECLSIAAEKGDLDLIGEIVEAGADVHNPDLYGSLPLSTATTVGTLAVMDKLLQCGAHPDLGTVELSWPSGGTESLVTSTPLLKAIERWDSRMRLEAVELLVSRGADVNQVDEFGYSPLVLAVEKNEARVVNFLLKSGADMNILSPSRKPLWEIAPTAELREILKGHYALHRLRGLQTVGSTVQAKKIPARYTMPAPALPTSEEKAEMFRKACAASATAPVPVPVPGPAAAPTAPSLVRLPTADSTATAGVAAAEEACQNDGEDCDSDYYDDPEDCFYYTDDSDVQDPDSEDGEEDEHDAFCGSPVSGSAERGDAAAAAAAAAAGADRALDRQLLRELLGTVQEQRTVIAALKKQLRTRK